MRKKRKMRGLEEERTEDCRGEDRGLEGIDQRRGREKEIEWEGKEEYSIRYNSNSIII